MDKLQHNTVQPKSHVTDNFNRLPAENITAAIMRNIAAGTDVHGGFLTKFAEAFVHADLSNQVLLMNVAQQLVLKYNLQREQERRGILKEEQYVHELSLNPQPRPHNKDQ